MQLDVAASKGAKRGARPLPALWWLGIPVGVAILIRVLHHFALLKHPQLGESLLLDSAQFSAMADAILSGDWFAGNEPFAIGPLYAYVLAFQRAVFGESLTTTFLLQALVGVGTVALITLWARRVSSRWGACFAGLAYAAYAPAVLLESKILGETHAVFFALLSTWLLGSAGCSSVKLVASGFCLGAASLARPDFMLFVPLGFGWVAGAFAELPVRERLVRLNWRAAGAWALPLFVVVSLATVRNYHITGEVIAVSSQGGVTFYQGNNPRAEGTFSIPEGLSGNKATQEQEAKQLAEQALGRSLAHGDVNGYWFRRGVQYLASDAGRSVELLCNKLLYWMSSAELTAEYSVRAERCFTSSLYLACTPFGLLLAAYVVGAGRLSRRSRSEFALLSGFVLSGLLTGLVFFVTSRYRLAAVAHLAVFVGPAFDQVTRWASMGWSGAGRRLTAGVGLLLLSFVPGRRAESFQAASEFYNLGNHYYRGAQFEQAISLYLTAVQVRPEYWQLRYNLAQAYAALGDFESASRNMAKVRQLNPKSDKAEQYLRQFAAAPQGHVRVDAICQL